MAVNSHSKKGTSRSETWLDRPVNPNHIVQTELLCQWSTTAPSLAWMNPSGNGSWTQGLSWNWRCGFCKSQRCCSGAAWVCTLGCLSIGFWGRSRPLLCVSGSGSHSLALCEEVVLSAWTWRGDFERRYSYQSWVRLQQTRQKWSATSHDDSTSMVQKLPPLKRVFESEIICFYFTKRVQNKK